MTSEPPDHGGAIDALIARYCAGTLSLPLHALIASHLVLSGRNRDLAGALDVLGGHRLAEIEPADLADRDKTLAAIFDMPAAAARPPEPPRSGRLIPEPLERLLLVREDALRWRFLTPGAKHCPLTVENGRSADLYKIRAGRRIPSHTHRGIEITLVLRGGFSDVTGHYRRGDVAVADGTIDHRPTADPDEDCICFAVADAPPRLTGPFGRRLQNILGA